MRLLDLYCCGGGAAMGYHRAGFEVVGVDIKAQPAYPFEFHEGDALDVMDRLVEGEAVFGYRLPDFDAIHASPPCQFATRARNVGTKKNREPVNLIGPTRDRLEASSLPYIIENVEEARPWLRDTLTLCGSMFGLKVRRHRLFESSSLLFAPGPCAHKAQGRPIGVYHSMNDQVQGIDRKGDGRLVLGGRTAETLEEGQRAMGIDWLPWTRLIEAIPPAYTEHLGRQLISAGGVDG